MQALKDSLYQGLTTLKHVIRNLWFRDPKARPLYINDVAVRIRAGILLAIPIYMAFTLWQAIYGSHWIVDGNTAVDTLDTDWDGNIIYSVQAIKKTYDWTVQTWLLLYGLFEMLAGMHPWTARLSPTIYIASLLAANKPPVWKPLNPKRFAWTLGAFFISVCLVFFNPEVFAHWVNAIAGTRVLPTTEQYLPYWIPLTLVWVCLGFMWMETVLGFCVGCQIHRLLVAIGILKEECYECNNIDWEEIARRKREREAAQHTG